MLKISRGTDSGEAHSISAVQAGIEWKKVQLIYLVLQCQNSDFVDIKFHRHFWLTCTNIAVRIRGIQSTRNKQLLFGVRLFVQEDLRGENKSYIQEGQGEKGK